MAGVAAVLAASPLAKGQSHLDLLVYQRDGALRLGAFDFATSRVLEDHQVFATTLETFAGLRGAYSDSPGWNAVRNNFQLMPPGAMALPGEAQLGFNLIVPDFLGRNFSYWNGNGDVAFSSVPSGEVLRYSKGDALSGQIFADGSPQDVPGYSIASTGPSGYVHRHLSFSLYGNSSLSDTSSDGPTAGVYLIGVEAALSGFDQPSNPAFVLLGHRVSSDALSRAASAVELQIAPEAAHSDIILTPEDVELRVDQTIHLGNLRESDVRGDGTVWATDNPGFAGNSFKFQDELFFDVTGPLIRWNGTNWSKANVGAEQIDFVEPSPFGEPLHSVIVTPQTTFAEGYRIAKANTRGTIHTHYTFIIRTTNGVSPAVGAYSFPLTIRSPQYRSTPTVELVFNNGLSEAAFTIAADQFRRAHQMRLAVTQRSSNAIAISLLTREGHRYRFENAPAPGGPWSNAVEPFVGDGRSYEAIIPTDSPLGFFRIRRIEP